MILSHLPFSLTLTPPPSLNHIPYPTSLRPRLLFRCHCRSEWGTNAESVRPGWFGHKGSRSNREAEEEEEEEEKEKRKWWSDYSNDGYDSLDDGFDDFGLFDDDEDESLLDKFWILKVLKSYGIFLPAIIGSMLLATGPKAFLMALALPLGQSAISILFENIWGKKDREKTRPRRKRRGPFSGPKRGGFNREENNNYKRKDYRSWVSMDNGDSYSGSQRSGLGGWDELDEDYETDGPVRKLSKKRKYKEVPLFMRLLVAVFPFLGSWFRIL
ncbi:hypothetical protein LUZ62_065770 [Rhynchospora pubera]|uniref:Uncharacterized protein n=1 Tax=Rhynchospora pubera TaxID=906938 RepID=A0AAV8EJV6_9POAL|nr:hypothetical protein LUZ62_054793 [Rhynchospora pubera]KAJ4781513.1 hypothetical protein LUZ62_065770 [Rhynchospora pubera]